MSNVSYQDVLAEPRRFLTDLQRRWLGPRGAFLELTHTLLYCVNWLAVRFLFHVSVEGLDNLPTSKPFILAPNHASPLDGQMLAAGLPLALLKNSYWAGKQSTVLHTATRRLMSRLARVIPIQEDSTALAAAVTVLEDGKSLIWFPEGKRSLDGKLQEFKPGVAQILTRCDVPVVPVFIHGAYEAFPSHARLPRWRTKVVLRIGAPQSTDQLGLRDLTGTGVDEISRAIETLREQLIKLRNR